MARDVHVGLRVSQTESPALENTASLVVHCCGTGVHYPTLRGVLMSSLCNRDASSPQARLPSSHICALMVTASLLVAAAGCAPTPIGFTASRLPSKGGSCGGPTDEPLVRVELAAAGERFEARVFNDSKEWVDLAVEWRNYVRGAVESVSEGTLLVAPGADSLTSSALPKGMTSAVLGELVVRTPDGVEASAQALAIPQTEEFVRTALASASIVAGSEDQWAPVFVGEFGTEPVPAGLKTFSVTKEGEP